MPSPLVFLCGLSLVSFVLLWAICAGGAALNGRLYEADEDIANPNQSAERR